MTAKAIGLNTAAGYLEALRALAWLAVLLGLLGSVGMLLRSGLAKESRLLMLLFGIWVSAPFVALLWASVVSRQRTASTRAVLYGIMIVLALCSLCIYGYDSMLPRQEQSAMFFVVVPPASWLAFAIFVPLGALLSGRRAAR